MSALKTKKVLGAIVVILIVIAAAGVYWATLPTAPTKVEKPVNLRIATGPSGWSSYARGAAFGAVITEYLPKGSTCDNIVAGGYIAYVEVLAKNEADIAWSPACTVGWAKAGIGPYEKKVTGIKMIGTGMGENLIYVMVHEAYPANSLDEIVKKKMPVRLVTTTIGSLGEWTAKALLDSVGVKYEDIKSWGGTVSFLAPTTLVDLMRDLRADMVIYNAHLGEAIVTELCSVRKMKFLPIPESAMDKLSELGFTKFTIPPDSCGKGQPDKAVISLNSGLTMFCREDLSNELVYLITKAHFEKKAYLVVIDPVMKALDIKEAWKTTGMYPLHPGAEKYYKEKGVM